MEKNVTKKNVLLTIAYDGSPFSGWQRQPGRLTVQGRLEEVLSRLCRKEIQLNGTSRTDAGVHALGQRASFTAEFGIPVERLALAANHLLAGFERGSYAVSPIRILKAETVDPGFHARFDAKGKQYRYKIRNSRQVDPFQRNYVYHVGETLRIQEMQKAAAYLVGTHDFKSFESSGGTPRQTTVRTIFDLKIDDRREKEELLEFCISGDGFLYNMVRIITGTLVDVGLGKIDAEEVKRILESRDRRFAGHTAPPYGLYLAEVYFD